MCVLQCVLPCARPCVLPGVLQRVLQRVMQCELQYVFECVFVMCSSEQIFENVYLFHRFGATSQQSQVCAGRAPITRVDTLYRTYG